MRWILTFVSWLYGAASAASLLLIIAVATGLLGYAPYESPLAIGFVLAMPWSLIALPALNASVLIIVAILALCMLLNGTILAFAAKILGRQGSPNN